MTILSAFHFKGINFFLIYFFILIYLFILILLALSYDGWA